MNDLNTRINKARGLANKYPESVESKAQLESLIQERAANQRQRRRANVPAGPPPAKPTEKSLQDQLQDAEKIWIAARADADKNNDRLVQAQARVVKLLPTADAKLTEMCRESLNVRQRSKETADKKLGEAGSKLDLLRSRIETAAPLADSQSTQQPSAQPAVSPTARSQVRSSQQPAPSSATETSANQAVEPSIKSEPNTQQINTSGENHVDDAKREATSASDTEAEEAENEARQLKDDLQYDLANWYYDAKHSWELQAKTAMDNRFRARGWTMDDRLTEHLRRAQQAQVYNDGELATRLEKERDNDVPVSEDDAALAQRMQLDECGIVQDDEKVEMKDAEDEDEEDTERESFSDSPPKRKSAAKDEKAVKLPTANLPPARSTRSAARFAESTIAPAAKPAVSAPKSAEKPATNRTPRKPSLAVPRMASVQCLVSPEVPGSIPALEHHRQAKKILLRARKCSERQIYGRETPA